MIESKNDSIDLNRSTFSMFDAYVIISCVDLYVPWMEFSRHEHESMHSLTITHSHVQ